MTYLPSSLTSKRTVSHLSTHPFAFWQLAGTLMHCDGMHIFQLYDPDHHNQELDIWIADR